MPAFLPSQELVLRLGRERRRFALEPGGRALVIGRGQDVQFHVPSANASRRHAEIRLGEHGLEVSDLGSANGTFLNGKKVERAPLAGGDVLKIGDAEIAIEAGSPRGDIQCERCGRLVSMATVEDGRTFEVGARVLCAGCRTATPLAKPAIEKKLSEALEQEGFSILARISPRTSWCPVFKARRRDLDDVVALKVLPITDEVPEVKIERFKAEARAMAQLRHPAIVPVYDVRHRPQLSLIVMEYIPGETLLQRIDRKGKLPLAEVLRHAIALAGALEAAGKLGFVHRNVKPSNVIITRGSNEPRLIDFGLAKTLKTERGAGLTDASVPLGTIRYMAPEQMRDAHDADPRSDIYALAATIFHALTGKLPHHERNELELLQAALDGKPLPFDLARETEIPQALKNVLACALMHDRNDRHPSATVLLDELRTAQSRLPAARETQPSSAIQKVQRGTFHGDELIELVRTLGQSGRSGALEVKSGVRGGTLALEDGRIVAARTLAGLRGEDAAYQIMGLWKGDWVFKSGPADIEPDAPLATHDVVLEVLRRRDETGTQIL